VIEEQATVVAVEQGSVWVETQRKSACGQCSVNQSCGTAMLGKILGVKRSRVKILNPDAAVVNVGDTVLIGISEQALVRGSLALYTLPLLSLFIFALLGETLASQLSIAGEDFVSIIFGVFGLVVGFVWVRHFSAAISQNRDYQPLLLRRLTPIIPVNNPS